MNQRIFRKSLFCLSFVLALMGCGNDIEQSQDKESDELSVALAFQVSDQSRAADGSLIVTPTLDGGKLIGKQHAAYVQLYVFSGIGESAIYTGYNVDVKWKDFFKDGLPEHTADMTYVMNSEMFIPGLEYTILGVAMSEKANESFGHPLTFKKDSYLGDITAALKQGVSSTGIVDSEIYVGTTSATIEKGKQQQFDKLVMKRRVSGVMGYFYNVPDEVLADGKKCKVDGIQVELYTGKNTALPLIQRQQKPYFRDFIESPSEDKNANNVFTIPVHREGNAPIDMNTVFSGGGYLLPMPAPNGDIYTLHVNLVDNQGNVLLTKRVKLPTGDDIDHGQTGGGTGIVDTESAFCFPIIANHFYSLGLESAPIDMKGNGTDITVTIKPEWKEENGLDLIERPKSGSGKATVEIVNQ